MERTREYERKENIGTREYGRIKSMREMKTRKKEEEKIKEKTAERTKETARVTEGRPKNHQTKNPARP